MGFGASLSFSTLYFLTSTLEKCFTTIPTGKEGWTLDQLLSHFQSWFGVSSGFEERSACTIIDALSDKLVRASYKGTLNGAKNKAVLFYVVNRTFWFKYSTTNSLRRN